MKGGFLIVLAFLAVWFDVRKGKIPNPLILTGLCLGVCFQLADKGILGIFTFLSGVGAPILLLSVLYYFRMIGAGDIKLLAALGGFLGMEKIIPCMLYSFLAGGVLSAAIVLRRRNLMRRLQYFFAYISNYIQTKVWVPYRKEGEEDGFFCFSIPVLFSVLMYVGGCY